MKKALFAAAALVTISLATTSCNKEKTCVCTTTYSQGLPNVTTELKTKESCSSLNSSTSTGGITATVTCVAK
jgi:hypothetical protein